MSFWVIRETGALEWHSGAPTLESVSRHLRNSSANALRTDWPGVCGYVAAVGLLMPRLFPRNPTGAAVLTTLGALPVQIGGAVIIAGIEGRHVKALRNWQQTAIEAVHTAVQCAIAGIPSPHGEIWESEIRRYAEWNNSIDPPPWQWRSTEFKI